MGNICSSEDKNPKSKKVIKNNNKYSSLNNKVLINNDGKNNIINRISKRFNDELHKFNNLSDEIRDKSISRFNSFVNNIRNKDCYSLKLLEEELNGIVNSELHLIELQDYNSRIKNQKKIFIKNIFNNFHKELEQFKNIDEILRGDYLNDFNSKLEQASNTYELDLLENELNKLLLSTLKLIELKDYDLGINKIIEKIINDFQKKLEQLENIDNKLRSESISRLNNKFKLLLKNNANNNSNEIDLLKTQLDEAVTIELNQMIKKDLELDIDLNLNDIINKEKKQFFDAMLASKNTNFQLCNPHISSIISKFDSIIKEFKKNKSNNFSWVQQQLHNAVMLELKQLKNSSNNRAYLFLPSLLKSDPSSITTDTIKNFFMIYSGKMTKEMAYSLLDISENSSEKEIDNAYNKVCANLVYAEKYFSIASNKPHNLSNFPGYMALCLLARRAIKILIPSKEFSYNQKALPKQLDLYRGNLVYQYSRHSENYTGGPIYNIILPFEGSIKAYYVHYMLSHYRDICFRFARWQGVSFERGSNIYSLELNDSNCINTDFSELEYKCITFNYQTKLTGAKFTLSDLPKIYGSLDNTNLRLCYSIDGEKKEVLVKPSELLAEVFKQNKNLEKIEGYGDFEKLKSLIKKDNNIVSNPKNSSIITACEKIRESNSAKFRCNSNNISELEIIRLRQKLYGSDGKQTVYYLPAAIPFGENKKNKRLTI